jgi:hypothetical protein
MALRGFYFKCNCILKKTLKGSNFSITAGETRGQQ